MIDPSHFLLGFFFSVLILVGLIGNLMVCLAVCRSRTLRKKRYCYFVSLAIADLILCIFVMPFAAVQDLSGEWIFGRAYCDAWYTLDILSCSASIFHLCAISIDRYFFIHDPFHYREKNTLRKVIGTILTIWSASIAVAASVLAMPMKSSEKTLWNLSHPLERNRTSSKLGKLRGQNRVEYDTVCGFMLDPVYALTLSSISFYVPCLVMIATYRKLYVYARNHSRVISHELKTAAEFLLVVAMQRQTKTLGKARSLGGNRPYGRLTVLLGRLSKRSLKRKAKQSSIRKARVTLGVTMGMFIFSWLGYFVCTVVRAFDPHLVPEWFFTALTWLGYANSAQNPIIYSIFNKDFRIAFARMIWRRKRKRSMSTTFTIYGYFYQQVVPL